MLVVKSDQGEQAPLSDSDLLVFLDETGHEEFSDRNNPVFGLGGCAVLASDYMSEIKEPWNRLKEHHFVSGAPMHAADIHRPTTGQLDSLASFFISGKFLRFATTITEGVEVPEEFSVFQITVFTLCKRLVDLVNLNHMNPGRIVLLFEHSERGNKLARRYSDMVGFKQQTGGFLPKLCGFVKKRDCEPGIEVADFVVHTAGAQSRVGLDHYRKDFRAIFIDTDRNNIDFLRIDGSVDFEVSQ